MAACTVECTPDRHTSSLNPARARLAERSKGLYCHKLCAVQDVLSSLRIQDSTFSSNSVGSVSTLNMCVCVCVCMHPALRATELFATTASVELRAQSHCWRVAVLVRCVCVAEPCHYCVVSQAGGAIWIGDSNFTAATISGNVFSVSVPCHCHTHICTVTHTYAYALGQPRPTGYSLSALLPEHTSKLSRMCVCVCTRHAVQYCLGAWRRDSSCAQHWPVEPHR